METVDLANSIGLSTRQAPSFAGMPLTKFAQQNFQVEQNNAKLEAEKARKQAELDKELMSKFKVTGKFDKISAPKVQQAYLDIIKSGGFKNPQSLQEFEYNKQQEERASEARKAQSELLEKSDLLVDDNVKSALIKHDVKTLEQLSKDPASPIEKDDQLPETYTLKPEFRIPRVKNINDVAQSFIPKNEAFYDYGGKKYVGNVGDKQVFQIPLKKGEVEKAAAQFFSNPQYAANYAVANKSEIDKLATEKKIPIEEATKQLFIKQNGFVKQESDTPNKGSSTRSQYYRTGNVLTTGKADKWTYTFDPKDNVVKINTGAVGGVPLQNLSYRKVADDGKTYVDKDKPVINDDVKIISVKPLKGGDWLFRGKNADGSSIQGTVDRTSLESYMSNFPAEDIMKSFYSKPSVTSTEKTVAPSGGGNKQSTSKMSYVEWKVKNPNGSVAEFKQYLK